MRYLYFHVEEHQKCHLFPIEEIETVCYLDTDTDKLICSKELTTILTVTIVKIAKKIYKNANVMSIFHEKQRSFHLSNM